MAPFATNTFRISSGDVKQGWDAMVMVITCLSWFAARRHSDIFHLLLGPKNRESPLSCHSGEIRNIQYPLSPWKPSEEDQCYVGSISGWIGKCCHGDNEEKVYHELCQILEEWIEIYKEDNRPLPLNISTKKYSGKFQLRIDSDLHKALAIRAMQANESLNSFCNKVLNKVISQPAV